MIKNGALQDIWVGIDLGTQSARAIAATNDGDVMGTGAYPLSSIRFEDRHEQNPEDYGKLFEYHPLKPSERLPAFHMDVSLPAPRH